MKFEIKVLDRFVNEEGSQEEKDCWNKIKSAIGENRMNIEKAEINNSFSLEEMKQAFEAGQETIWEDLEQTIRCAKFESFEMWFENYAQQDNAQNL